MSNQNQEKAKKLKLENEVKHVKCTRELRQAIKYTVLFRKHFPV